MQKKMMLLCSLFLCTAHQLFTSFHHAAKLLQRCSGVEKNSAFTHEFLSSFAFYTNHSIAAVRLFSQVCLDKDLEDEIFKLAAEEEVGIRILLSRSAAQAQLDGMLDMQDDGIDVAVLPDEYRFINWELIWEDAHNVSGFKITNNKDIKSSMTAALISYEFGNSQILLCNDNGFSSLSNKDYFTDWQRKFDCILHKSKR